MYELPYFFLVILLHFAVELMSIISVWQEQSDYREEDN